MGDGETADPGSGRDQVGDQAAASGRAGTRHGRRPRAGAGGRLGLDQLEFELFEAARAMGMRPEAIAAVLELPDAAAAEKRQRWLERRRALPYATASSQPPGAGAASPVSNGRDTPSA